MPMRWNIRPDASQFIGADLLGLGGGDRAEVTALGVAGTVVTGTAVTGTVVTGAADVLAAAWERPRDVPTGMEVDEGELFSGLPPLARKVAVTMIATIRHTPAAAAMSRRRKNTVRRSLSAR